ncbi:hypothetical protein ACTXT7_001653 [Hymenolepis weldensis]
MNVQISPSNFMSSNLIPFEPEILPLQGLALAGNNSPLLTSDSQNKTVGDSNMKSSLSKTENNNMFSIQGSPNGHSNRGDEVLIIGMQKLLPLIHHLLKQHNHSKLKRIKKTKPQLKVLSNFGKCSSCPNRKARIRASAGM